MICTLCPRRCGAQRTAETGGGFCRMPSTLRVARAGLHHWEEPPVSGTRGSGTVFFSGCTLRCVFCQNHDISTGGFGREISAARLRDIFHELIAQGAHNINLVTPTHFTPWILEALDQPLGVPVVWNCGGYESVDTLRMLEGKVDVYLPDLKYADSELAAQLSAAPDYFQVATAAIEEMVRQVGQPINQISQQVNVLLASMAGAERIFAVMDAQPEVDEGKTVLVRVEKDGNTLTETTQRTGHWAWKRPDGELVELRGDVRFHDVTFGYTEEKTVLHNISLYAKPGQKIAFVGSTGAGKTTITNLINRFYDIQSGTITYDGIDVTEIAKDSLRRSLGIVLQDTHLFTGTIADNIRYGKPDATDEEIRAAARLANADTFIRHLPQGYDPVITGDGGRLSQGERQLLAIARAAVSDPPVLILDEATSSIDTRTEKLIEQGMDSLMEERTVFVIAHRLSTVRNAQAIMVLEQGEIIERGDHNDLIAQRGKYYQLYTGQAELS